MKETINSIFNQLNDDILSHGLLAQTIDQFNAERKQPQLKLNDVLQELLRSERIEIGTAKRASADYVEFIAWKGTVAERILKATKSVEATSGPDREFAYWLCLRTNIDRYEDQESDRASA